MLLPFVIYGYEPMTMQQTVFLLLGGVFATIGQFGITLAYKFAPAKEISVFNYFTVVFTALLGLAFLGQVPDRYSVLGYIIIFGASLFMFMKNKGESKEA